MTSRKHSLPLVLDIPIGVNDMYDDVAILKAYGEPTYDEYGNEKETLIERTVYVQPRGVYQSEFYNAAQVGLKPNLTLYLTNRTDYMGEKVLSFQGKEYSVIRVDMKSQRDGVSLICEEKVNGN